MKTPAVLALALAAASIGFGAGYYVGSEESNREREDLALQGVLESLGQIHFLERQDVTTASRLANINLDGHLRRMQENEGHNSDPEWLGAKARALNAVALRWEGRDLLKELGLEGEVAKNWAEGHSLNLAMLRRAQEECRAHPEYECKTQRSSTP
jgi:hypothetical protein